MRQFGKQILTIGRRAGALLRLVALAAGLLLAGAPAVAADSVVNGLISTDPLTGVAMEGYDPVSYFTRSVPTIGAPEYEYTWSGVPFYFASAANRDAFAENPDVYAPVFGGYGVMGVARGFLASGNPRIYAVLANRLFLFYSTGNREAFLAAPRAAYEKAVGNWPKLSQTLVHDTGGAGASNSAAQGSSAPGKPAAPKGPKAPATGQ